MTTTLKIKNINSDNYKKFYGYINRSNDKNIDSNNAYFQELQKNGIECEYLEITPVNSDVENGNIKMILSTKHSII